jgi:hypothetical protein
MAQCLEITPAAERPLDHCGGGFSGLEMDVQLVPSLDLRECPVSMSIKAAATIKVSRDRCSGLDVVDEGISLDVRHIPAVPELPAASRQVERHNTVTVLLLLAATRSGALLVLVLQARSELADQINRDRTPLPIAGETHRS